MAVRCQLNPMRQAGREISNELNRIAVISFTDQPCRYKLCVRADRRPCPDIPKAELAPIFLWDILSLGIAEPPNFVALNSLTRQVPKFLILIPSTRLPKISEELEYGSLRCACHATSRPNRVSLNECRDDLRPTLLI